MSLPELKPLPIPSSNIAAAAHHDGALYVKFHSGKAWKYPGVSPATYNEMLLSGSVGSYFSRHVKPRHPGEEVHLETA